jgi:glycosyltransferase involved in cell wall biosynthesis
LRIVITTTLNDNLFHAKLVPLVRSRPDIELVVVSDREGPECERVRWVWPRGFTGMFGRLGGRLLLLKMAILHPRTKLVMAYSLVPHGMFAILIGHLFRKPVWVHYIAGSAEIRFAHNTDVSDNRLIAASRNPRRLERMARWFGLRADRVFVPGSKTADFLSREGYDPKRIVKLHSTIDPARFYPTEGPRDFDVLISAQLRERKRPRFTLEVLREILRHRPDARFCWLGDGLMHDEFDRMLDEYGLREHLTWTVTDKVGDYYRRGKVFLLCSINEGLSLASMEAMGCGMVPVASDCGDMFEVVRTGETGVLLPIEASVEDYAQAVLTILKDDSQWAEYSQAAMDLISREHSFDSAIAAWQALLAPLEKQE